MSLRSRQFLRQVPSLLQVEGEESPDIQFVKRGYLILASKEGERILRENCQLQRSLGAEVEVLDLPALARRFPWMNLEGVAAGSLGKSFWIKRKIWEEGRKEGHCSCSPMTEIFMNTIPRTMSVSHL